MAQVEGGTPEGHPRERDPSFMREVASTPRGRGILACIQCGRCTSSCPVARLTTEHNPRRLMEMITVGSRSEVVSRLAWYCTSCFICLDRCPQGGDVGEVTFALRNLAARQGKTPAGMIEQARSLINTGRIANPSGFVHEAREKLGLPKIQPAAVDEVRIILGKTGFTGIVSLEKGAGA